MPANRDVAFEILHAVRRIHRQATRYSWQVAQESGMSVTQTLCLKAIHDAQESEEVTAAMISEIIQLSPSRVTVIVDGLEVAGLVTRERRSKDRRKVCLTLTNDGRKRLDSLQGPLQNQFLSRLKTLKAGERRSLLESLNQVVEMLEED